MNLATLLRQSCEQRGQRLQYVVTKAMQQAKPWMAAPSWNYPGYLLKPMLETGEGN